MTLLGSTPGVGGGARILPHDREAEQSVLGALMLDQNAVVVVRDILAAEDFYEERHQGIYQACLELNDRGEPIDVITLRNQLERHNTLSRSGGIDYLSDLSNAVPTAASVRHYADIVIEHAVRRRLVRVGQEIADLGLDDGIRAEQATDLAEQRVFAVAQQRRGDEASHIAPILRDTWSQLETLLGGNRFVTGVATNFGELDKKTQGLQSGELIILAARPSVGKTSLALNIARNAAVLAKQPTVVFSLEMSRDSLVQRLLCSEAAVDSYLLKTGQARPEDFQRIAHAMDKLTQAEIWIDDTPGLSISQMRARARRMKAQHGIKLIVVDYLQLMRGGRQESRVQEVSDISAGLKGIAKELQLPVLALSQLSRESERRQDRTPQLSDLRDSGCLTGDARVWLPREGRHARMDELAGRAGFEVLALDSTGGRLERRTVSNAFSTGVRPTLALGTRSGRGIRATANHRFLTAAGWRRVDQLQRGSSILVRDDAGTAAVTWDAVESLRPAAPERVYDLTVPGLHNFVVEDVVAHNSIEQDADIVLFLYRPGMHDKEHDLGDTKLIVAKNRNGPIGDIDLIFNPAQTAFREPYHGRGEP